MTDYSPIIKALEEATEGSIILDVELLRIAGWGTPKWSEHTLTEESEPTRSVDSALALAEAVLPEYQITIIEKRDHWLCDLLSWNLVGEIVSEDEIWKNKYRARQQTLPLAICLALVRALQGKSDD